MSTTWAGITPNLSFRNVNVGWMDEKLVQLTQMDGRTTWMARHDDNPDQCRASKVSMEGRRPHSKDKSPEWQNLHFDFVICYNLPINIVREKMIKITI